MRSSWRARGRVTDLLSSVKIGILHTPSIIWVGVQDFPVSAVLWFVDLLLIEGAFSTNGNLASVAAIEGTFVPESSKTATSNHGDSLANTTAKSCRARRAPRNSNGCARISRRTRASVLPRIGITRYSALETTATIPP
jgi:hypothetical protein